MKAIAIVMTACLLLCGCNLFNQHAQMMDAMRGVMSDTASRLGENGTGQVNAGGQVINPGIRVSGGMEYYATATYEGVAGQITASMQGDLSRTVPADVQERCNTIWRNTSWSSEQKRKMVENVLFAWIKTQVNDPATSSTSHEEADTPPAIAGGG